MSGADEIMIIGGAEIYAAFMPHVTRLYYSGSRRALGDASFPLNDFSNWKEISRELVKAGPKDSADFSNILYEKLS